MHEAHKNEEYFRRHDSNHLECPPYSPDSKILENMQPMVTWEKQEEQDQDVWNSIDREFVQFSFKAPAQCGDIQDTVIG